VKGLRRKKNLPNLRCGGHRNLWRNTSQIYNEPLIIAALLWDSRQTKLCDPLKACTL
jgi:hypothetical protein